MCFYFETDNLLKYYDRPVWVFFKKEDQIHMMETVVF